MVAAGVAPAMAPEGTQRHQLPSCIGLQGRDDCTHASLSQSKTPAL